MSIINCLYGIPMDISSEKLISSLKDKLTVANVILKDPGPNSFEVIKLLRQETDLSAKEARKKVTETKDALLFKEISIESAEHYKKDFEELGAVIELVIVDQ